MNFCIARYLRIKSPPIKAVWFIKTNFLEGVLKYFRQSIGAIVFFEDFTLAHAGSQNWKKATWGLPLTQFRVAFDVSVENSCKKRNFWKGIRLFSWLETSRRKFGFYVFKPFLNISFRLSRPFFIKRNWLRKMVKTVGKRDYRTESKLIGPEFSSPFAKTVEQPVYPCK